MEHRTIVGFHELSEEWQKEAISNLDEYAEETLYLEPIEDHNPKEHILWDLSEAMKVEGEIDGFKYNSAIGISNNSSMLLDIDEDMEYAKTKII